MKPDLARAVSYAFFSGMCLMGAITAHSAPGTVLFELLLLICMSLLANEVLG